MTSRNSEDEYTPDESSFLSPKAFRIDRSYRSSALFSKNFTRSYFRVLQPFSLFYEDQRRYSLGHEYSGALGNNIQLRRTLPRDSKPKQSPVPNFGRFGIVYNADFDGTIIDAQLPPTRVNFKMVKDSNRIV